MNIEQQAQNALDCLSRGEVESALSVYESIASDQRKFLKNGDKPFADVDVCLTACRYFMACNTGEVDTITNADKELSSAIKQCLAVFQNGDEDELRVGFVDANALIYIAGLILRGSQIPLKFLQLKNTANTQRRERPKLAFLVRDYALCCLEVYIRAEDLPEERKTLLYKAIADLDTFAVEKGERTGASKTSVRINGQRLDCSKKMEEIYKTVKYENPRLKLYLIIAIAIIFGISDFFLRFF